MKKVAISALLAVSLTHMGLGFAYAQEITELGDVPDASTTVTIEDAEAVVTETAVVEMPAPKESATVETTALVTPAMPSTVPATDPQTQLVHTDLLEYSFVDQQDQEITSLDVDTEYDMKLSLDMSKFAVGQYIELGTEGFAFQDLEQPELMLVNDAGYPIAALKDATKERGLPLLEVTKLEPAEGEDVGADLTVQTYLPIELDPEFAARAIEAELPVQPMLGFAEEVNGEGLYEIALIDRAGLEIPTPAPAELGDEEKAAEVEVEEDVALDAFATEDGSGLGLAVDAMVALADTLEKSSPEVATEAPVQQAQVKAVVTQQAGPGIEPEQSEGMLERQMLRIDEPREEDSEDPEAPAVHNDREAPSEGEPKEAGANDGAGEGVFTPRELIRKVTAFAGESEAGKLHEGRVDAERLEVNGDEVEEVEAEKVEAEKPEAKAVLPAPINVLAGAERVVVPGQPEAVVSAGQAPQAVAQVPARTAGHAPPPARAGNSSQEASRASNPTLAQTGASVLGIVLIAVLMLIAGATFVSKPRGRHS